MIIVAEASLDLLAEGFSQDNVNTKAVYGYRRFLSTWISNVFTDSTFKDSLFMVRQSRPVFRFMHFQEQEIPTYYCALVPGTSGSRVSPTISSGTAKPFMRLPPAMYTYRGEGNIVTIAVLRLVSSTSFNVKYTKAETLNYVPPGTVNGST